MDKKIIGGRLRRQREDLQLTREKFAEIVGISAPFLAEIESGRKGMSAETLYKICKNNFVVFIRYSICQPNFTR